MGKNPIVSVTYENKTISIKNSLPGIKCVLRFSCVVHWPIYGRFLGRTLYIRFGIYYGESKPVSVTPIKWP